MTDLRLSARGIIDFTNFDSAVFGSSLMENTSIKEASEKLGGKWADLAFSASSFNEREILLEHLFKRKQMKQIIYSIEPFFLMNDKDEDMDNINEYKIARIQSLLYKYNTLFDFKHYLNKHTIKCVLKWSKKPECIGDIELPKFGAWYIAHKDSFDGFKTWSDDQKKYFIKNIQYYQNKNFALVNFNKQDLQNYIERSIFRFVKQNPQTNFYFIIPTHPRLLYLFPSKIWTKNRSPQQFLHDWQDIMKYFVKKSAKYKNVKIYGFDDLDYANNLSNYCDDVHYNIDMNLMQLDAIANGTHILTPENIDEYLQTMENKIKAYDLAPLIQEIKEWERNSSKKQ